MASSWCMYASDLSGQSLSIEAVGKVLSIAKVLVLQPLRQIYLSPLSSHFPSRRAHRIMKCNYHKEIVFLFFIPILMFAALSRRPEWTSLWINQKWTLFRDAQSCGSIRAFGEKCRAVSSLTQTNSKVKPISHRPGMFISDFYFYSLWEHGDEMINGAGAGLVITAGWNWICCLYRITTCFLMSSLSFVSSPHLPAFLHLSFICPSLSSLHRHPLHKA